MYDTMLQKKIEIFHEHTDGYHEFSTMCLQCATMNKLN